MKARIAVTQMLSFQMTNRLKNIIRDDINIIVYAGYTL